MDATVLENLGCTDKAIDLLLSAKEVELTRVSSAYACSIEEVHAGVRKKLLSCGMHLAAGNCAVDFLIVDTDKGTKYPTFETAMAENILAAGIYFANCLGKDPSFSKQVCYSIKDA